jgi:hypothetical protein
MEVVDVLRIKGKRYITNKLIKLDLTRCKDVVELQWFPI